MKNTLLVVILFIGMGVSLNADTKKEYHPNGKIKVEATYKDGKKEGITTWYYDNGKIRGKVPYVNGEKHGDDIAYHKNGKMMMKITYVNGYQEGHEIWYDKKGNVTKDKIISTKSNQSQFAL